MTKKQKSFVVGAAILGVSGIICKAIGAVFRIPLANIVGELGMGNYQLAYPIYAFLLVISTAGLPTAISKLVSERIAKGDRAGAHYVFKTAFKLLVALGVLTAAVMLLFSSQIAAALGRPEAAITMTAIAPSLFFVSILSAYRGYFQGMQDMTPTALTQLVEQVGKLCFGLFLASAWIEKGPEYGAAGALLGVTLSEILALLIIMLQYARKKGSINDELKGSKLSSSYNFKSTTGVILKIAVPITIGACIMPLVSAIDSAIVIRSLTSIGYDNDVATSLFGLLTGYVNPLINMPAVLSLALAMSLVPAISASRSQNDIEGVRAKSSFGFRLAILVGMPCAAGFYILAEPILTLLYSSISAENLPTTVELLKIMSFGVLFLTMVQTMTGILQGLGKVFVPVINLFIGAVVKIIVSLVMIKMPEINVLGAAYGTLACYAIAAVLDVIMVIKFSKFKFEIMPCIVKPVICTAVMGVAAYYSYALLGGTSRLHTLIAIFAAVVVYAVVLILLKTLKPEDMQYLPGGRRLSRMVNRRK